MIDCVQFSFRCWCNPKDLPWRRTPTEPEYYWLNHKGLYFRYYPGFYEGFRYNPLIWISFSPASYQNDTNAKPYRFDSCVKTVRDLEQTILEVTGRSVSAKEITCISRIDLNRDFHFSTHFKHDELMDFFARVSVSKQKPDSYATGITLGNGSVILRVYRKDLDPHIPQHIRDNLPTTTRVEMQLGKRRIKKHFPESMTLYDLLTDELLAVRAWNTMLQEYRLDGAIYSRRVLYKKARVLFSKNTERIRRRKIRRLKMINSSKSDVKHQKKTEKEIQAVKKELSKAGICPYAFAGSLTLRIPIYTIIIKNKKQRWVSLFYVTRPTFTMPKRNSKATPSIKYTDTS